MDLFLVYAATGDFYEPYVLYEVGTTLEEALRVAKKRNMEIVNDEQLDGYKGELVFIREIRANEVFENLDLQNVPKQFFIEI